MSMNIELKIMVLSIHFRNCGYKSAALSFETETVVTEDVTENVHHDRLHHSHQTEQQSLYVERK